MNLLQMVTKVFGAKKLFDQSQSEDVESMEAMEVIFPSADESAKESDKNVPFVDDVTVLKKITEAIREGRRSCAINGKIPDEVKQKLAEKGYTISNYRSLTDKYIENISW